MKSHREPEYICTLCNKPFTTKQFLNRHYETHNVAHTQTTQCLFETAPEEPTAQVNKLLTITKGSQETV